MDERTLARLQWACRRGMLELDIWLQSYLHNSYPNASHEDQREFEKLLEFNDQDLFDWLMGNSQPADKNLLPVIDCIRASSHENNKTPGQPGQVN